MVDNNVIQHKLLGLALQILDLCSPVSDQVLKKYFEERLMQNTTDSALDFARLQFRMCKLNMNDDTLSIVYKLRDTIVLLELLHTSKLVSEDEIAPIMSECNQLLEMLQDSEIFN
jgi:hypothetical protein